jgi:hypothetical protein
MASVVRFFMSESDERAFLTDVAPLGLELYPEVVPPGYRAPIAGPDAVLEDPALYLALPEAGPVKVDKVKRGPDRGKWMVMEVTSPVIHWQRSIPDEHGAIRSGRLWAELQVSGDVQKRIQKSTLFESTFRRVEELVRRRARRSDPVGYWVLPGAVREHARGVELREDGRNGKPVRPFR